MRRRCRVLPTPSAAERDCDWMEGTITESVRNSIESRGGSNNCERARSLVGGAARLTKHGKEDGEEDLLDDGAEPFLPRRRPVDGVRIAHQDALATTVLVHESGRRCRWPRPPERESRQGEHARLEREAVTAATSS